MICFYHSADLDGSCSGAIVKLADPACKLYPIDCTGVFPWDKIENRDVVMVDFSLQPWTDMERLITKSRTLTWIDHHKTAIEQFEEWRRKSSFSAFMTVHPSFYWELCTDVATCELCWKHYFPDKEVPEAVRLLGAYKTGRTCEKDWETKIVPFQRKVWLCGQADPINNMSFWKKLMQLDQPLDFFIGKEGVESKNVKDIENEILSNLESVLNLETDSTLLAKIGELAIIAYNRIRKERQADETNTVLQ